jgi:hypothetical protein
MPTAECNCDCHDGIQHFPTATIRREMFVLAIIQSLIERAGYNVENAATQAIAAWDELNPPQAVEP